MIALQKRFWMKLCLLYMLFKGHFSKLEVLTELFMSYFFDYNMVMNNTKYYNVRASTVISK